MDSICRTLTGDSLYKKGCTDCKITPIPHKSDENYDEFKSSKQNSIIILVIISLLFLVYFFYINFSGKGESIFTKIKNFYGTSFSQLSFSLGS